MHEEFDLGTSVHLRATFRKRVAGVLTLTTPTTTTLKIKKPSGTVTTVNNASLTTESTGVKTYDTAATDEAGDWWVEFTGAGNMDVVKEYMFRVKPSLVP